jgi:superfamily I DNA/RNA helicase/RecB family exonuclease
MVAVSQSGSHVVAGGARRGSAGRDYRLVRRPLVAASAPVLDADQRRVVEHPGGPLLVLAGPGTGKTTTLVEAVAARIEGGLDPEQVLVLTFGRKAAAELRERVAARLGRATKEPLARTFHSYAFGVLRREAALRGDPAPRLLSGPEQDLVIRELLDGDLTGQGAGHAPGSPAWPERLLPALRTRGFVQELRDLMMRAYERGVGPRDLARLGRTHKRDDWVATARFMEQYAQVTALSQSAAYDPAELIRAVVSLWLADTSLLERERAARRAVFVDEMQDTDPAQIELLRLLAGDGRDLVAVGDPDQSIYGFRGADRRGIDGFAETFRTSQGAPAPTFSLHTCRRSGSVLLETTGRMADQLGRPSAHRRRVAAGGLAGGRAEVVVLRSESQEAAFIASRLRTAHLVDGVPWSDMAVVVRSTVHSLPVLRRALGSAGVPVGVPAEEVPLAGQPAVRPLLTLLRCVVSPERLDEDAAVELLTSPFGGADVIALRRLRQELRRAELAAGGGRTSGALLVEALHDPRQLVAVPPQVSRAAERVARLLAAGRSAHDAAESSAEDVLWAVWARSGLAPAWERRSLDGGSFGLAADRDLDAVVALFEAAARFCDRLPGAGAELFVDHVEGQQIPGDTLAPRAPGGEAVTVLTAHASKGLEWRVVCVAGVQEGLWPSSRLRGSFLGSERLVDLLASATHDLPADAAALATLTRLLDEERRLFYVAVTRARERLLVTAVTNEREGLAPSRFLDELDPLATDVLHRPTASVTRPMTLSGLVAELRRAVQPDSVGRAPTSRPTLTDATRRGAATQLARLAAAGARGAGTDQWWGLLPLSDDRDLRGPDERVRVSPSKVDGFTQCELRWFLEQVGGGGPPSTAQTVGTLVHAVAESALDDASATEQALLGTFEGLLATVELGSGWPARKEVARARTMVSRLAQWLADNQRQVVAAEVDFLAAVGRADVAGRVDRLERDADGRGVVLDFKTGSSKADDLDEHPQLAAYQVAVEAGAFTDVGISESGGAALVQLGKGGFERSAREQAQPLLSSYDDPDWAQRLVAEVAEGMAGSAFRAVQNKRCTVCPVRTSCPVQDDGRTVTT